MTIKQIIDKFFESRCPINWDNYLYCESDFWKALDELESDIDRGGVQWALEWQHEAEQLSEARENYIKSAIDNYIEKKLEPIYTNK